MKPRLFVSVVVCFACVAFARASSGESGPAGIVSELQGSANIRELRKPQRALQVYDWITDGASIAADRGSRVVIVLASGARFALKEGPRVAIVGGTLPVSRNVEALSNFPPLPVVAPIASQVGPPTSAATRIRGRSFSKVYPEGHTTLADSTTLRLKGPPEHRSTSSPSTIRAVLRCCKVRSKTAPSSCPRTYLRRGMATHGGSPCQAIRRPRPARAGRL